jgi:vacuolar-type H+-ATPase subunit I/STV1
MPSDQDVFSTNDNVATPNEGATPVDLLASITDENGRPKYDSVEKAIEALSHSQTHIRTLEAESKVKDDLIQSLKTEAEKANSLESVIQQLTNEKTSTEQQATPQTSGLTEQHVLDLVKRSLQEQKTTEVAVNNVKTVNDKLVNKYGEKASEVIQNKAKELNTTPEALKNLSASNPNLVLALFGDKASTPSPSVSSVNISGQPTPSNEIKRPEVSILSGRGATLNNQIDLMKQIRAKVYAKHGITDSV